MNFLIKIFKALFFWGLFGFVVLQIPYPESLTQANIFQLNLFFIPLFLAILFTLNILLNNIFISEGKNLFITGSISLGIILLLILKALDSLNLITGVLVIIPIGLLVSYFRKFKRKNLNPIKSDLTKLPKIPKLTDLRRKK